MLNEYLQPERVMIACGYTDLRCGIDGLAALVQKKYRLDPFADMLFCSAEEGPTESKDCTGTETDF